MTPPGSEDPSGHDPGAAFAPEGFNIFISYRREDEEYAQALERELKGRFGGGAVFSDRRLGAGAYPKQLVFTLRKSEVLLPVIGPGWLRRRRELADPEKLDWVRNELKEADDAGLDVVPVCVGGVTLDRWHDIQLPQQFAWLHEQQAVAVETVESGDPKFEELVELLEGARKRWSLEPSAASPRATASEPPPGVRVSEQAPPALSIGIDVGATKLRGCVVDIHRSTAAHDKRTEYHEPVAAGAGPRALLAQSKALITRIIEDHCADTPPIGIGVGVPGQVDLRAGTLKFGPNLFQARNVPFKTNIASAFADVPVRVDNEVRCATRCELHLGTGHDFDDFACIFVGTGVGSGLVVNRRVYFGSNYCAGEVGHIKIASNGPPCVCGQIGCLETFVKAQAIVERAEAKAVDWRSRDLETVLGAGDEPLTPELVADAIESGDAAAQEVADEVAEYLGRGIANYLNLVNPAAIVLGGGLMRGFFLPMINGITHAVRRDALAEVSNVPIVESAHSDDGIATGAALLFHPGDYWPF